MRERFQRPFSSISMNLTQIMSPTVTTSSTFSTRFLSELGDVDQTVLARGDLHEGAELHQAHDAAVVELADLGTNTMSSMHFFAASQAAALAEAMWMVPSSSMSIFAPVSATIFWMTEPPLPMTSRMRSGSILHGDHLGRVGADLGARLGDAGQHDLVEDLHARVVGDVQRVLDDRHGQAVVLEVHLDGGDAPSSYRRP